MLKNLKRICLLTVAVCLLLSMVSFAAAPDYVSMDDKGTVNNLIKITRPDKDKDFSYDQGYYFSGTGKSGVKVTLYKYASGVGAYAKMKKDGKDMTMTVGSSGLFWATLPLTYGDNFFLARAENTDGSYQICTFRITYQTNSLQGISVNFSQLPLITGRR